MKLRIGIFIWIFVIVTGNLPAQNRKGQFRLSGTSGRHELYFALKQAYELPGKANMEEEVMNLVPEIRSVLDGYEFTIERGAPISEQRLRKLEANALRITGDGTSVRKLRNILHLKLDNPANERLLQLAASLEKIEAIDYVSLMPLDPVRPPADIAPTTPNFLSLQEYVYPNPGVNMQYAWLKGLRGEGIRVRDVEYGFNPAHEEIEDIPASIASGMTVSSLVSTEFTEHGTATIGVLAADRGAYGVTGMVSDIAEVLLYPEYTESGYNRTAAVSRAIDDSDEGDVIIYEMQTGGKEDEYVPAEYDNVIWDLTKAATDAGIVIVAAAGNGNQDLDHAFYAAYNERGNSGAIIVGAGSADMSHNRLYFSTYGSRVDLQGWGESVLTSGYGDYTMVGGDFDQAYTMFSGTSSATPVVASCIIALQSYHHSITGSYMTGQELKDLLIATGTPQGDAALNGKIGPLPNMSEAYTELTDRLLSADEIGKKYNFSIFPNPAANELNILLPENLSGKALTATIYNLLGQDLLQIPLNARNKVDINHIPAGIYIVNIMEDGRPLHSSKFAKK